MLVPSGRRAALDVGAQVRSTRGATAEAAPLAQSTTTRQPVEAPALDRGRHGGGVALVEAVPAPAMRHGGAGDGAAPAAPVAARRRHRASSRCSSASSRGSTSSASLRPPAAEELDAVVGERVVRRRDHGRRARLDRPTTTPPRGWGRRPGHHVGALAGEAGGEGGLEQRARNAGCRGRWRSGRPPAPGPRRGQGQRQLGGQLEVGRPRTPSVPNSAWARGRQRGQRLEYCGPCGPS